MILHGDCLEKLKDLADNSVDAVVTDPPYGLKFMGKKWDYEISSVEIWSEVYRVLKPGGHLLSFGGTRTYHRMVVNIEDAGFEIRDQIAWIYGSGFPKSHDVSKAIDKTLGEKPKVLGTRKKRGALGGVAYAQDKWTLAQSNKLLDLPITEPTTDSAKQWQGWGSALKPAIEPIVVARKPLERGLTLAENVLKYGTGGLNIDGSRVLSTGQRPDIESSWESAEYLCNLCVDLAALNKKHPILATKESIATKSVEQTLSAKENGWHLVGMTTKDIGCLGEMSAANINTSLSMSTSGKAQTDKNQVDTSSIMPTKTKKTTESKICVSCLAVITHDITLQNIQVVRSETQSTQGAQDTKGRWPSNCIFDEEAAILLGEPSRFFYCAKASKRERNAGLEGMPNGHPCIKPIRLMEYLCKLITPPNGTILDPFMGSGSTGIAAKNLGFDFIGIEREKEYCEIAEKRIAHG